MIIWNRCENVMPDTVGEYLTLAEYPYGSHIEVAWIEDDVFIIDGVEEPRVTHWSELNKPDVDEDYRK